MSRHLKGTPIQIAIYLILLSNMIFKIYYSSTIIPKLDFNVILRQYKDFIKAAISSTDTIQSIEKLKIKLLNEKSPVPLQTISAINIIDPQKIELSIFDPSVNTNFICVF